MNHSVTLERFFLEHPKAALAFSGGTDSAYLLYAARYYGCDVHAYYVRSQFQPEFEAGDARRLQGELRAPMTEVPVDILRVKEAALNPPDRCYHCKRAIFGEIARAAADDGYPLLMDGTNASDEEGDRPGMRALRELGVRSPLRECGITKSEVRRLSREAGLFTWEKPAYACLATRIPTGTPIEAEDLERVESAEKVLASLGFTDFRVRLRKRLAGDKEEITALVQLADSQMSALLAMRERLLRSVGDYFDIVALDLQPRKSESA